MAKKYSTFRRIVAILLQIVGLYYIITGFFAVIGEIFQIGTIIPVFIFDLFFGLFLIGIAIAFLTLVLGLVLWYAGRKLINYPLIPDFLRDRK